MSRLKVRKSLGRIIKEYILLSVGSFPYSKWVMGEEEVLDEYMALRNLSEDNVQEVDFVFRTNLEIMKMLSFLKLM